MTDNSFQQEYLQNIWPDTYKRHSRFSEQLNELLDRQLQLLAVMGAADDASRERCYHIVQLLYSIATLLHTLRQHAELSTAIPPHYHNALYVTIEPLHAAAAGLQDGSLQLTKLLDELHGQLLESRELFSSQIMEAAETHLRMLDQHAHTAEELGEMFRHQAERYEEAERAVSCMLESPVPPPPPAMDELHISAVSPQRVTTGDYGLLDVVLYEDECRETVERILAEQHHAREHPGGVHQAARGSEIEVVLSSPDVQIDEPRQTQRWRGKYLRFSFDYLVPEDFSRRSILLRASVYIGGVPATKLSIRIDCGAPAGSQPAIQRTDVKSAFISYAHPDRPDVLRIVQGIQQARPDLKLFVDIDSLHSREYWEERIFEEIDRSDVLYLCWSEAASQSPYVEREWRHALCSKGLDGIEPLPLTPPENCPPPAELQSLHFNNRLLYIIHFQRGSKR